MKQNISSMEILLTVSFAALWIIPVTSFIGTPLFAQQSSVTSKMIVVRGTFLDADRKPLKGVKAILMAVTDNELGYTFPSEDGHFDTTTGNDGSLSLSVDAKTLGDWKEFTLLLSAPGSLRGGRVWASGKPLVFTVDRRASNNTVTSAA